MFFLNSRRKFRGACSFSLTTIPVTSCLWWGNISLVFSSFNKRSSSERTFLTKWIILPVSKLPENDKDGDGILDTTEAELGTSSATYDTDEDGLSDKVEIERWKTDPMNKDTDGDGFADGYEVLMNYNPNGSGRLPE